MTKELGRFGHELYQWDPNDSDPRNPKWLAQRNPKLLVGRGTGTSWWTQPDSTSYLPVDAFGGAFKTNEMHLWMDFNLSSCYLPANWAQSITFDYSTWRYMKPVLCLRDWCRILQNGQSIYFEGGISSFKLGSENSFENENPSHLVLTHDSFLGYMENVGQRALAQEFLNGYRLRRTIVIPAHDTSTQSIEKQVGQHLRHATENTLFETYRYIFEPLGVKVLKCSIPLQTSHPVKSWVELRKN
jgi:hypothetical protein